MARNFKRPLPCPEPRIVKPNPLPPPGPTGAPEDALPGGSVKSARRMPDRTKLLEP